MMKKYTLLMWLLCAVFLTGCHKHITNGPATCTEAEICLECEKVVAEALGHQPGPAATCAAPQSCERCAIELSPQLPHNSGGSATCTQDELCLDCGAVITAALGHNVGADGSCGNCGEQLVPAGERYIPAGKGSYVSDDTAGLPAETERGVHYHNDLDAYYANAVLVCGDYGVEYFLPDTEGSSSYANMVNKFADKYPQLDTYCLLIPKCCAFESPAGYDDPYEATKSFIQSTYDMMDNVITADCMGQMTEHDGEYMFYRTDHHWTSLGAYYASRAFCEAAGITPYELDSYDTVVQTDYVGSLHMYADYPDALKRNPDYTVARFPHVGYSMVYYSGGQRYQGEALNGNSNSYAGMFICGDQPLTVFTGGNKNGKALLVFKESYGNAFVPYMIDYYETVVVVDVREDDVPSTQTLIGQYNITDALFINNCQGAVSLRESIEKRALS